MLRRPSRASVGRSGCLAPAMNNKKARIWNFLILIVAWAVGGSESEAEILALWPCRRFRFSLRLMGLGPNFWPQNGHLIFSSCTSPPKPCRDSHFLLSMFS